MYSPNDYDSDGNLVEDRDPLNSPTRFVCSDGVELYETDTEYTPERVVAGPDRAKKSRGRLAELTEKFTIKLSAISNLYKTPSVALDPNLIPRRYRKEIGNSGREFCLRVSLWNGKEPFSSERVVTLAQPRILWNYHCSMEENIRFVVRTNTRYVPRDAEIRWISLNQCRFSGLYCWSFFDSVEASLKAWQRFTQLSIGPIEQNSSWNECEKTSIEVCCKKDRLG